jgi:pimeloyl-ACP methyl ester carboxylesterase
VNGTTLAYTDEGTGPAVVLLHGLGASSAMMSPQAAALREAYRVIAVDLRGNGESGQLGGPAGTVLSRQADDVADLLQHLDIPVAVLCGVSYGGVLAQCFADRHADLLHGLVLVDTFSNCRPFDLRSLLLEGLTWATLPLLLRPHLLVPLVRAGLRDWPLAAEIMTSCMAGWRPREVVRQRVAVSLADTRPALRRVHAPLLGIVGTNNQMTVRRMRELTQEVPNGSLHTVDNSTDPTNLCQPEAVNALLLSFLGALDQDGSNWSTAVRKSSDCRDGR